jgi:RNA polymerase sigma-70 factor (ECF subfamily)
MEYKGDQWYIKRVLRGDAHAYACLVDRYKDMVFSLAVRMVRNREEAEEAAQDTFVKAYRSLRTFRGQARFSTWIYKITYNTCISRLRKHKPVSYSIDEATLSEAGITEMNNGLRDLEREERRMMVNRSLQELDAEEGFLITLYYYDDKKLEEIAGITGLTKNHVKVKLFRARKRMLYLLQNYVLSEQRTESCL